ncbi:HigA family addiction module antitoxin [Pelomicrobium methylotrophicum]|uniref:HigA family addiction module antidote protein n=1 Tax=Pelomicrobium methylotrophicum TaxID=2602750 RepID=A0A5C7EQW4_9PROT|nr:HigA family addiction module antitoxin [Pelomicrobium methylotrophicum]TXF09827.1 HigA family addiction module antidote protein [Pelomicrobium methylotrophicum]
MRKIPPVSPGEMLMEEFLKPFGMSQYSLAKEIGAPARRINEIILGKRAITPDTDLRLCRDFSLPDGRWLRLQAGCDIALAREKMGEVLQKIKPLRKAA